MNVQPPAPHPSAPQSQAPGAAPALVLGILSILLCPLCGPFAIALGRKAEQEIRASGGQLGGAGIATAGKILGIIGCIFLGLLVVALLLFALGSGGSTSSA